MAASVRITARVRHAPPARVEGVPVAMECRVDRVLPIGNAPTYLVLARVVLFHVRDDLLDADGRIDQSRWVPMGRLGGQLYAARAGDAGDSAAGVGRAGAGSRA